MYEVEKDVPMPRRGIISELPISTMDVGDSFLVPKEKVTAVKGTLTKAGREFDPPRTFAYRTDGEGIRVWRAA